MPDNQLTAAGRSRVPDTEQVSAPASGRYIDAEEAARIAAWISATESAGNKMAALIADVGCDCDQCKALKKAAAEWAAATERSEG